MNQTQWLTERKKGIGGTDISAIIGINPYKTAYDVWLEKTGQAEPQEENDNMLTGKILEDSVAELAEKKLGYQLLPPEGDKLYYYPDNKLVRGTPDRFYINPEISKNPGIMEIKTTQTRITTPDDVPQLWVTQLCWYMGIYNAQPDNKTDPLYGTICYLHSGRFLNFDEKRFVFDEKMQELFDYLVEQAEEFWNNYVLTGTPPPAQTPDDIIRKNPWPEDEYKDATDEILYLYESYREKNEQYKALEKELNELKDKVKMFIGEDYKGVKYEDEKLFDWVPAKGRTTIDKDKLKEEYPEVYEKVLKEGKPTRKFLPKL